MAGGSRARARHQEPAVDTSFDAKAAALKLAELKDGLQRLAT